MCSTEKIVTDIMKICHFYALIVGEIARATSNSEMLDGRSREMRNQMTQPAEGESLRPT